MFGKKKEAPAAAAPPAGDAAGAAGAAAPATTEKAGCCGRRAAKEPEWGMMPAGKRKCRDCFCCSLFVVFWLGMIAVGVVGLKYGNWMRLVYGTDYKGQTCGSDADVKDRPLTVYPRTNEDFLANQAKPSPLDYTFYGVCVKACPGPLEVVCNYDKAKDSDGWTAAARTTCWGASKGASAAGTPTGVNCDQVNSGGCWINPLQTSAVMFRCIPDYNVNASSSTRCAFPANIKSAADPRCVVAQVDSTGSTLKAAQPNLLFDNLNTGRALWGRWFGDLARSYWVILLCGVGVALVAGFAWVQFLKTCTGYMVWTTIAFTILSVAALTGFFYYKAGLVVIAVPTSLNDKIAAATGAQLNTTVAGVVSSASGLVPQSWTGQDDSQFAAYKIMAYVSTGVLVVLLCVVASMASAIRTAIEVIRIGCKALQAMPELLFLPLSNVLALGLFLVWWVFVAASLQSAGTIDTTDLSANVRAGIALLADQTNLTKDLGNFSTTMSTVQDLPVLQYLQLYHVFGLLWTVNFINGVGAMTVAGAVCAWYFSQLPEGAANDPEYEKLRYGGPAVDGKPPRQRCVACGSLARTLRFYLGSVAFGSLLIAIIQAIRLAFVYLQRQMEQAGKGSVIIRWIFFCVQACLKCVQSIVEAVTTNAYIFVALKGDSFCASGGRVFKLIINHGAVFAAVNVLGTIIVFLGQVCVSVIAAAAAYVIVERSPQFQPDGSAALSATWLPILVTLLFAYVTAGAFMGVFDLSIDSVLVCYCTDVEENMMRHEGKKEFKTSVHMPSSQFDAKKRAEDKAAKAAAKAAAKEAAAGKGKVSPAADEAAEEKEKAASEGKHDDEPKASAGKVAKGKSASV